MSDALLLRAAEILEREADPLEYSHMTPHDGSWDDAQAQHDYNEMLEVARLLRVRAEGDAK